MGYATTNPFTNEVVKTFPDATDTEVDEALERAHEAFLSWRTTSFAERASVLSRAADLARERREDLARLNTLEMGKLYSESLWEVETIAQIFDYYAEHGEEMLAPTHLDIADPAAGDAVIVYQPLGVVFAVEPWNVPLFQVVRPLRHS